MADAFSGVDKALDAVGKIVALLTAVATLAVTVKATMGPPVYDDTDARIQQAALDARRRQLGL